MSKDMFVARDGTQWHTYEDVLLHNLENADEQLAITEGIVLKRQLQILELEAEVERLKDIIAEVHRRREALR